MEQERRRHRRLPIQLPLIDRAHETQQPVCGPSRSALFTGTRRPHRRLPIQLPLICRAPECPERVLVRSKTINVSTGGLYFETLSEEVRPGQRLELELTVPPGDGHFPYQGRVMADGGVRFDRPATCNPVCGPARSALLTGAEGMAHLDRIGVAASFNAGLRLSF